MKLIGDEEIEELTQTSMLRVLAKARELFPHKLSSRCNISWVTVSSKNTWGLCTIIASDHFYGEHCDDSLEFFHLCNSTQLADSMNTIFQEEENISFIDSSGDEALELIKSATVIYIPLGFEEDYVKIQRILLLGLRTRRSNIFIITFSRLGKNMEKYLDLAHEMSGCRSFLNFKENTAYFYVKKVENKFLSPQHLQESSIIRSVLDDVFTTLDDGSCAVRLIVTGQLTQTMDLIRTGFAVEYVPRLPALHNEWISTSDLKLFLDDADKWYNGSIVNTFIFLLRMLTFFPSTSVLASSYALKVGDEVNIYDPVWEGSVLVDLTQGVKTIILPVCISGMHWITLVVRLNERLFEVFDCGRKKKTITDYQDLVSCVQRKLEKDAVVRADPRRPWKQRLRQDLPKQSDNYNCGPLMLYQTICILFCAEDMSNFPKCSVLRLFFASIFLQIQFKLNYCANNLTRTHPTRRRSLNEEEEKPRKRPKAREEEIHRTPQKM